MLVHVPSVLSAEEVSRFRARLAGAPWGANGRASPPGPQSGAVKHNRQLPRRQRGGARIGRRRAGRAGPGAAFPQRRPARAVYPPLFNRYADGMDFGAHIDNAIRRVPGSRFSIRTDLSATLFLNQPEKLRRRRIGDRGYLRHPIGEAGGGGHDPLSRHQPSPRHAGDAGERVACFFWVQSLVADDAERTMLFDLDRAIAGPGRRQSQPSRNPAPDRALSQSGAQMGLAMNMPALARSLACGGPDHDGAAGIVRHAPERRCGAMGRGRRQLRAIAEAQLRLGRMLLEGEGVSRDARAAFACFLCAAESGDVDGHNMLGRCLKMAGGTEKDFSAAAYHYRIAAEAGMDWAQYNLGHHAAFGKRRDARPACGVSLLWPRRGAGPCPAAMNLLGRCYEQGWGVARDMAVARAWYPPRSAEGWLFSLALSIMPT